MILLIIIDTAAVASDCSNDRACARLRPPMGWRAWYAFPEMGEKNPNQAGVIRSMDAMASRSRLVDGNPTSLIDLGYTRASIDGRYLNCVPSNETACKYDCGGVNGSYHDEHGSLIVNKTGFPDIPAMTAHGHSLGLSMGWYTNNFQNSNCESGWSKTPELYALHMQGEADWVARNNFDELKVDSGGSFNNMTWWERALNATGRPIAVENCHQGSELPNASWCPFQQWRTSGDPKVTGVAREMMDTAILTHAHRGCWAYPGYAIFGADANPNDHSSSTFIEWRTSFGLHAIISSPLILSFDVTSNDTDAYWPILSNKDVIAVNQNWAGSVGSLVRKWNPDHENVSSPLFAWALSCTNPAAQSSAGKWVVGERSLEWHSSSAFGGASPLCLDHVKEFATLGMRPCNASSPSQGYQLNLTDGSVTNPHAAAQGHGPVCQLLSVWATSTKGVTADLGPFVDTDACGSGGSGGSRHGRMFNLTADGRLVSRLGAYYNASKDSGGGGKVGTPIGPCLVPQRGSPNLFGPMQLWSKPQPNGAAAVFINNQGSTWGNNNAGFTVASFKPSELPGLKQSAAGYTVKDLWNHTSLPGVQGKGDASITTDAIHAGDSRFYLVTPVAKSSHGLQ